MRFEEISHIVISVVTISIAFAIALSGSFDVTPAFANSFLAVLATVGVGFVSHELAHKYVAMHYGAHAEYRAWTVGILLALFLAIGAGFVFAAPGAVYIYGSHLTREHNGRIAIAGPVMNLLLAAFFFMVSLSFSQLAELAAYGVYVNLFLAAFNLIPFGPLDGAKVYAWDRRAWALAMVPAVFLLLALPRPF